jgi:sRNA-binding protein
MNADYIDRDHAIEILCELYPKAFFLNPRQRKPLKHDIIKDIKAEIAKDPNHELRFYDIDDALAWYCNHISYHINSSVPGTKRVDLNGKSIGAITETEAREAHEQAQAADAVIQARKQQVRFAVPTTTMQTRPAIQHLQANTNMNNEQLLESMEKHFRTLKTLMTGDTIDDSIRKEIARPVLLLLQDELRTLDARLTRE